MLRLADVRHRYQPDAPWAVDGVSFALGRGEIFGLLGPNGAGKTTLMALIAGLLEPQGGVIDRVPEVAAAGGFALVPQEHAFYPMLTCRENLEFFAGVLGLRGAGRRARVDAALETAGLALVARKRAGQCSGGLKRRLNFAIGLVGEPQLLLLDEPTTGVDPQSRAFLLDAVRALRAGGRTVVYTSHYMEEVQAVCDRVAILDHGRVLCCGSLGELLSGGERDHARLYVRVAQPPPPEARAQLAAFGLEARMHSQTAAASGGDWLVFAIDDKAGRTMDAVLAELRRLGLSVTSVQFGARHLEDVFLKLTHRSLRD